MAGLWQMRAACCLSSQMPVIFFLFNHAELVSCFHCLGQRESSNTCVRDGPQDLPIRRVIRPGVARIRRQRAKTPLLLVIRRPVSFAYVAVLLMVDPHGTEISPFAAHRPTEIL
jgi:hypothetical protein